MAKYTLALLRKHKDSGELHMEVRYKGFAIQKRLSSAEPKTMLQYVALTSGNKMLINNEVEKLGNELVFALKKDGKIDSAGEPIAPEWIDLMP